MNPHQWAIIKHCLHIYNDVIFSKKPHNLCFNDKEIKGAIKTIYQEIYFWTRLFSTKSHNLYDLNNILRKYYGKAILDWLFNI